MDYGKICFRSQYVQLKLGYALFWKEFKMFTDDF